MSDVIITAIISGLCVAIPSITSTIIANKRNQELLTFQIQEINKEISELKNNVVRMYDLEKRITLLEEGAKYGRN